MTLWYILYTYVRTSILRNTLSKWMVLWQLPRGWLVANHVHSFSLPTSSHLHGVRLFLGTSPVTSVHLLKVAKLGRLLEGDGLRESHTLLREVGTAGGGGGGGTSAGTASSLDQFDCASCLFPC